MVLSFLIARRSGVGQLLVRNVDDRVIEAIKLKAELNGRSLEQELREILKRAAGPTAEERLAMIERVVAMQNRPSKLRSENVIRKIRNRRT
jgi:plasmid stability protein